MEIGDLLIIISIILLAFTLVMKRVFIHHTFLEKIVAGIYITLLSIFLLMLWYFTNKDYTVLLILSALFFLLSLSLSISLFSKTKK